jgi:RNA polymerase sigma-70 factor (sigma-E family)
MSTGFDEFVVTRGHALLRFAHVLCGDLHLGEDLVQEVLARTHRQWVRIEQMQAPEAYLRKAIVREFLSWRRRLSSTETPVPTMPEGITGEMGDPAHRLAARDEMWMFLAGLPRAQRAVMVLRYYADMTDDEIAATLDCGASTVRAHAARALSRLRTVVPRQREPRQDTPAPGTTEVRVERP